MCCAHPPGNINHPTQLDAIASSWITAVVPGTAAAALQQNGKWDLRQPLDADASDWWYRTNFAEPERAGGTLVYLCFDGLATLADVWLNGQNVLTTDNMFRGYQVDITRLLRPHNELVIAFRSLAADLARKRPRPRWKTNLVQHQQLRWRRTSLLGRIPEWSPRVPPVGPWRAVRLDVGSARLTGLRLASTLEGTDGVVTLCAKIHAKDPIESARFQVEGHQVAVPLTKNSDGWDMYAVLHFPDSPRWFPHTHGNQPLVIGSLEIKFANDEYLRWVGSIGFRRLEAVHEGSLAIQVNGVPIYCRGACWTVSDIVNLDGDAETLAHDLRLARDAGVNMLRVGGTMIYESDLFYDLCDQLGILVWQDFPFANMDYPIDDADFARNIEAEAIDQLERLARHPCLAVLCGNSEVEQQAAMLGVPRELWRNTWFNERLPALCREYLPEAAYFPSSPSGGVLPFHLNTGITHYYGVGAYLRSPGELRQADVKFASECLAFANIPDSETVDAIMGGGLPAAHHPDWKQRIPRDTGAGWDFEDVRDHYLQQMFGVNPVTLRSFDMPRYLQLSRVVPGELMAQVYSEWRSSYSSNRGGLIWFFKDLWPAAGWGIVDSFGKPKAAYYQLRRVWSNLQVVFTDEGLNGLHVHVINEKSEPFVGTIEVLLLRDQRVVVAKEAIPCNLPAHDRCVIHSDAVLGAFYDVNYCYRFGPPKHDLVVATLFDNEQKVRSEAFFFVQSGEPGWVFDVYLNVVVTSAEGGGYRVAISSDRFLQSVQLHVEGYLPDDNYFHLTPGREKVVHFRCVQEKRNRFHGYLEAINLKAPFKFAANTMGG